VGCLISTGKGISNPQKERNGFPGCEKDDVSSEISRFPRYSQHLWLEGVLEDGSGKEFVDSTRLWGPYRATQVASLQTAGDLKQEKPGIWRMTKRKTWDLFVDLVEKNPGLFWKKRRHVWDGRKKNCLKDVEGNSYKEDWSSSTKDIEFSRSKWGADQLLYSDSSRCFRDLVRNSNGLVSS